MKRTSIYSILTAFALTFLLSGCGAKRDEALVTEYNAKKTEAETLITNVNDGLKKMTDDHTAWTAKIDEAAKAPKADTAKLNGFKRHMAGHGKIAAEAQAEIDSLKAYIGAKTSTNEELKSAIGGLNTHIAALSAWWKTRSEEHAKLGADIMAALPPSGEVKKEDIHATAKPATNKPGTPPAPAKDDGKVHPVKNVTPGGDPVKPSRSGGVKK